MSHWPKILLKLQVCFQGLFPEIHPFWAILRLTNFRTISDMITGSVYQSCCQCILSLFECFDAISIFRFSQLWNGKICHFKFVWNTSLLLCRHRDKIPTKSNLFSILIHTLWFFVYFDCLFFSVLYFSLIFASFLLADLKLAEDAQPMKN